MERHERTIAAAAFCVLLGLVLAFLARCVPPDRAPVSVDPLYSDPAAVPFAEVRPAGFQPSNPYTSDTALVFYPWLAFMAREIESGTLPLWSPLSGGGLPMMGNLSSALFFPTTWLCFVPAIGVARGMFYGAVLKLLVAGFFAFLLLRRWRAPFPAALAGAIGFAFFGYQVVWLNYSLANVSCLLPLCLWLADRFAERSDPRRGLALAIGLALQFLGGHAETSLALGLAVVAWLAAAGGVRVLVRLVPYGVVALALCSFQLLPFVEYLADSQGRIERTLEQGPAPVFRDLASLAGGGAALLAVLLAVVAFRALRVAPGAAPSARDDLRRGLVAGVALAVACLAWRWLGARPILAVILEPGAFGGPVAGNAYRGPERYPDVNGGFVGIALLVLAVLHALAGRTRARIAFSVALMLGGFCFAAAIEPLHGLLRLVPPFDLSAGSRMLPLFATGAICGAVFAAIELAVGAIDGAIPGAVHSYRAAARRLLVAAPLAAIVACVVPLPDAADPSNVGGDGVVGVARISSPADGTVLRPAPDGKGGADFRVVVDVAAPDDAVEVIVHIGRGHVTTRKVAPGLFRADWSATTVDGGAYAVVPEVVSSIVAGATSERIRRRGAGIVIHLERPIEIPNGAWWSIAVALLFIVAMLASPRLAVLLPVVVALELFRFGVGYNPAEPIASIYPETSVTRFLSDEAKRWTDAGRGPFRVLCEDVILQPNMNHAYGLQVVREYDQLANPRFRLLLNNYFVNDVPMTRYDRDTIAFRNPFFDLFNLAYVVTGRPLEGVPGFELVHQTGGGHVYRNANVVPRAFLAERALNFQRLTANERLALDPRGLAILDHDPPLEQCAQGSVRFLDYRSDRVSIEVDAAGPSMLVLTDNAAPGWSCEVDGVEAPISTSHLTFRAVQVPAGRSVVRFDYRPSGFRFGLWLAAVALVVSGGAAGGLRRPRKAVADSRSAV